MAEVANRYPENVTGVVLSWTTNASTATSAARPRRPISRATTTAATRYVYKQPGSPEEEALCKEAMEGCPVEAIGNNGRVAARAPEFPETGKPLPCGGGFRLVRLPSGARRYPSRSMTPAQLRARVLTEWRGLPEIPFPRHNAKAIGATMTAVMEKLGLGDRLKEEEVLRSWAEIVGDFVSRHSTPQRLPAGVLTVRVLQPTLRYELDRVWKQDILEKLKARFGPALVREVKFLIG